MVEEHPSFERPPFYRKHTDTTDDIISIRLNPQEREQLKRIKQMLRLDADGTALKTCLTISQNVLLGTFGADLLAYLTDARRVRPGRQV